MNTQNQAMRIKSLKFTDDDKKLLKNLAHMTKEMLCPLNKAGKLHVTKQSVADTLHKHFFHSVSKRFNATLNFVTDNNYKVMCYYKHNQLFININANDPVKQQKFYLAHMLGHLICGWSYLPNTKAKSVLPKVNLKALKAHHNLLQICGDIRFYNFAQNEMYANYFAEQLLGYDIY